MIAPTTLGVALIITCALALIFRPQALAFPLVASAFLHAPVALLVFHPCLAPIGIPAWQLCGLFVGVACAISLFKHGPAAHRQLPSMFLSWTPFFVVAIAGSLLLPWLFRGTATYNPAIIESIAAGPVPLEWGATNAIYALNFINLWIIILFFGLHARTPGFGNSVQTCLILACFASLLLTAGEYFHIDYLASTSPRFDWTLNPSYVLSTRQPITGFVRIGWPFSEPSYASAWYAGALVAGLTGVLFCTRIAGSLVILAAGLMGLIFSLGGSGLSGAVVGSIVAITFAWMKSDNGHPSHVVERQLRRRRIASGGLVLVAGLIAGAIGMWAHPPAAELAEKFHREIVEPRLSEHTRNEFSRMRSNEHALSVTVQTYGLGVGIGSSRASSFAMTLLSSVGVIGIALLVFAILHTTRKAALFLSGAANIHIAGGLVGVGCSALIGIPDPAWPGLWIWLIVFMSSAQSAQSERHG